MLAVGALLAGTRRMRVPCPMSTYSRRYRMMSLAVRNRQPKALAYKWGKLAV